MTGNIKFKSLEENDLQNIEVLEKYGKKAAYTDLYLISGGNPNNADMNRVKDEFGLTSRVAPLEESLRIEIDTNSSLFTKLIQTKKEAYNGTYEIELGEYPQYVSAHSVNETLEYHYQKMLFDESSGILIPTGKTYTIYQNGDLVKYKEYYHDGKKYVRINLKEQVLLSNANTYYKDDYVWFEVSKVKWLIDEKSKKLISKLVHLPNLNKSYSNFFLNTFMLDEMLNSSMTKKDILEMIAYVMKNVKKEHEEQYLELVNKYPEISILSQEELEKLLLNISKLNDKIQNFDYELTWKMK